MVADVQAICRCDPESDCGDNCINRIMSYLCGKNCPCGARCTNKSLAKRKGASVKVSYVSGPSWTWKSNSADSRLDHADSVSPLLRISRKLISSSITAGRLLAWSKLALVLEADGSTYQERCKEEYAVSKNFYALAYDQDEVIDAVSRDTIGKSTC